MDTQETPQKNPAKTNDVPVTRGMLFEVRDELSSRINGLDHRFDGVDNQFRSIDKKFESIDSRFVSLENKMNSRFDQLHGTMDQLRGDIHRIALLVEDQNARNKFVLDGYTNLYDRQTKLEPGLPRSKTITNPSSPKPH